MQRINITLTDKQLERMREYSSETEITISELIRRLIDGFFWQIDKQEPDPYGDRTNQNTESKER
jgi:hypothetical protein